MGFVEILILLLIGFVAFFATGIDDTVAYAGSYVKETTKKHRRLISLGIFLGTFIALSIAIFAGSLLEVLPSRHLIGGTILIILGTVMFLRGNWPIKRKKAKFLKLNKKIKPSKSKPYTVKFIGLGLVLFFGTGIDDIIAYSNLIMAKGSWLAISLGVLIATIVSLVIANLLSGKLKKLPHPEKIGATMIIIIGALLALRIL